MKMLKTKKQHSNIELKDEYKTHSIKAISYAVRQLLKIRKSLNPDEVKTKLDEYIQEYENKKDLKARLIDNA